MISLLSQSGWPIFTSSLNSVTKVMHSLIFGILRFIWYKNGIRKPKLVRNYDKLYSNCIYITLLFAAVNLNKFT